MKKTMQKSSGKKSPPPAAPAKTKPKAKLVAEPQKRTKTVVKKKEKRESVRVLTPRGRFSFPRLAEPNSNDAEYDPGKYTTDFIITHEEWKASPAAKALKAGILKVAREYFDDESLELSDFKHPLKNLDKVKTKEIPDALKGHMCLRAKTSDQPVFIGNKKNEDGEWDDLSEKKVSAIKSGDWGRLVVSIYAYEQQGGGIAFGLENVQFIETGESLGGSKRTSLNLVDEVEAELEDPETEEEDDQEESDDEESGDDSEDDEDETEEESEDEEEEEVKPKGRKGGKSKKSSDDDDDF